MCSAFACSESLAEVKCTPVSFFVCFLRADERASSQSAKGVVTEREAAA